MKKKNFAIGIPFLAIFETSCLLSSYASRLLLGLSNDTSRVFSEKVKTFFGSFLKICVLTQSQGVWDGLPETNGSILTTMGHARVWRKSVSLKTLKESESVRVESGESGEWRA